MVCDFCHHKADKLVQYKISARLQHKMLICEPCHKALDETWRYRFVAAAKLEQEQKAAAYAEDTA